MNRFIFFLLLLVSCNNESPKSTTDTANISVQTQTNTATEGERLVGLLLDSKNKMLSITVISNGCTTKNDFRFTMKNGTLLIERIGRDDCKRMPFATTLQFSFAEAGIESLKSFQVKNEFSANLISIE